MTDHFCKAVRCAFCGEPIPVSSSLLRRLVEPEKAFILRCDACSRENRYLKSQIEVFEANVPESGSPLRYRVLRKAAGQ